MTRKEQLEKYQAVVQEQRDFLNSTTVEDFTKNESYVKRETEINSLFMWLQADKQTTERESALDHQVRSRENGKANTRSADEQKDHEVRAFVDYMRHGDSRMIQQQRADMASNGTTTGGYFVPTFVSAQVIQDLEAMESVRKAGAQVMAVQGLENLPIMQDPTAHFIVEANSLTASDPTVARVTITPNLLVADTKFSWQLVNRSAANIVDEIRKSFVRSIAKLEASKFLYGSGTNEPQGLVAAGTQLSVTASATTFTAAEMLAAYDAINPIYAQNGTWIMYPSAASIGRQLQTTNGQLVWYNNLVDGTAQLYGRPVIVDANMDAVAANKQPIVFADVNSAYVIGEEVNLTVLSDPYTAAGTGESKLYVYKFVDGKVKKAAAAQVVVMHS